MIKNKLVRNYIFRRIILNIWRPILERGASGRPSPAFGTGLALSNPSLTRGLVEGCPPHFRPRPQTSSPLCVQIFFYIF